MDLRVCPDCEKAFYAFRDSLHVACHYCGHVLIDRRVLDRTQTDVGFSFVYDGKRRRAKLKNFSETGVKIAYKGLSLRVGSVLTVKLSKLHIDSPAKMVWTKEVLPSHYSGGFKFIRQGSKSK